MKSFYHLTQFMFITFLFGVFKLIGFKYSSNIGFFLGKTLGPIFRSKSLIIKNLEKANIKGDFEKIASNVLGKKLYNFFENILSKIPLVSYIYNTIKQITETLTISQKQAFKKVVYIEYPKENIWTIALVTGESRDKTGVDYYQIFVPTTPNPTSGFMLYIKKSDAKETNLSVPLVVRLAGTNFKEGKEILDKSNLKILSASDLNDAAKKIVEAIN